MQRQNRSQTQGFSVLPQQIQLLKLFHLNTVELQQRIQEELMENPALEENECDEPGDIEIIEENALADYQDGSEFQEDDIPDYKIEHNNYLSDSNLPQRPLAEWVDFRSDLKEQMGALLSNNDQRLVADHLIDSLNDEGLLLESMEDVADDLSFQQNKVISVLEIELVRGMLLELEPKGVGCTSIREFMLLQLHEKEPACEITLLAIRLLEDHFSDLAHRNMEKIALSMKITALRLREVLERISTLRMKPLVGASGPLRQESIVIDFIVTQHEQANSVSLFHQRSSTLFIRNSLKAEVAHCNQQDKQTLQYLKSKISSAQWFVSAIKQRETTMLNVMNALVRFQADYFKDGDIRQLKPMILKDIADEVGVDISTASRITCNKYADTPFGTILLKNLFSKGIENTKGEAISNRVIQKAIEEAVSSEDKTKPYTDQELVGVLASKGFDIARRTVAKYREQRQIPVMKVRALWGAGQAGTKV